MRAANQAVDTCLGRAQSEPVFASAIQLSCIHHCFAVWPFDPDHVLVAVEHEDVQVEPVAFECMPEPNTGRAGISAIDCR